MDITGEKVARLAGVSRVSTAIMAVKLCESGYIQKEHYGQIALTESGVKAANFIYTSCIIIRV